MQGNGQTELTEALVGLRDPVSGSISIGGRRVNTLTTDQILELGVGYVPEDRLHDGLVGSFSVAENLVLDMYDRPPFAAVGNLDLAAIARNAEERVAEFDVRTPSDRPRTRRRCPAATSRRSCWPASCRVRSSC